MWVSIRTSTRAYFRVLRNLVRATVHVSVSEIDQAWNPHTVNRIIILPKVRRRIPPKEGHENLVPSLTD